MGVAFLYNCGGSRPQLHTPTIYNVGNTIYIVSPATNGDYPEFARLEYTIGDVTAHLVNVIEDGQAAFEIQEDIPTGTIFYGFLESKSFIDSEKVSLEFSNNYEISETLKGVINETGTAWDKSMDSFTITYSAAQYCALPSEVSVVNADYTWDSSTGELVLTNPDAVEAIEIKIAANVIMTALSVNDQITSIKCQKEWLGNKIDDTLEELFDGMETGEVTIAESDLGDIVVTKSGIKLHGIELRAPIGTITLYDSTNGWSEDITAEYEYVLFGMTMTVTSISQGTIWNGIVLGQ